MGYETEPVHQLVSDRHLAKVRRTPDKYHGCGYIVHGHVVQADLRTGDSHVLAVIRGRQCTDGHDYRRGGGAALITADPELLEDVLEGDLFTARVTVIGERAERPYLRADQITVYQQSLSDEIIEPSAAER